MNTEEDPAELWWHGDMDEENRKAAEWARLKRKAEIRRDKIPNKVRFEVLKRDQFACIYCGGAPPEIRLVIDHLIPLALGGSNDITNLVTACVTCNAGKGSTTLEDASAVQRATERAEKMQQAAVALGRNGGLKGGHARAAALTPERRSEIAKAAALKRWAPQDENK